ncbi:sugar ABC transporter permease [Arthrobacter sp. SW1]|uniref:ABC transporter permease n=1 Tax=Arthrobacter sp. SW1 TaxID=1920889 RepID=UPI000877BFC9|nr:ABC transporter permease [Arthrobacter sp. SW1]OFI38161.1 sugar ABC transporter permease [Arthrobacter sp. SW1]
MNLLKERTAIADTQRSFLRSLLKRPEARIFLVLVLLIAFFAVAAPASFATAPNIRNIAADASVLMILAVGSTFIILTSGIDLSINGVLVFSGVISAKTMTALGGDTAAILLGLLAGLVSGCLWGILNGILVAKARIPALIVTLGTLGMSLGAALLITGGVDEREIPLDLTLNFGSGRIAGVPWLVVVAALVALIGGLVLATTRFGRYTYAAGSNPEALRRSGVSTSRHLIKVYAIAGTLSGLAGFVSLARFATTTLGGHSTDNLQTIAAVVIGGTSLFGGVGTMIGTVIGVFIPAVLQNGFVVLGLQPFWQQVAVGAVLIGAVYVDQLRRRNRDR